MASEGKSFVCKSCGGPLEIPMNTGRVKCPYCGCMNVFESEELKATFNYGDRINIESRTNLDNLIHQIKFEMTSGNYNKADSLIDTVILSMPRDNRDYRVYLLKADLASHRNKPMEFINCINEAFIIESENESIADEAHKDLCEYMSKKCSKMIPLQHGVLFRQVGFVQKCLEHGSDPNIVLTGIGYTQVPVTPLVLSHMVNVYNPNNKQIECIYVKERENDEKALQIRKLLKQFGAVDSTQKKQAKTAVKEKSTKPHRGFAFLTIIAAMVGIIACFVLVDAIVGGTGLLGMHKELEYKPVAIVTVEQVFDDRDVNNTGNAIPYNNQMIELSGTVTRIKKSFGRYVISLSNDKNYIEYVGCTFDKNLDKLEFNMGDNVSVIGVCNISNFSITMRDCLPVK